MTPAILTLADLQLSLIAPELWMTLLTCVVLSLDFACPKLSKPKLAYIAIFGMGLITLQLSGYAMEGKAGVAFGGMFVLDPLALFFKIFILVATILMTLASIDALEKIPHFRGEYYFLLLFSALGMMFMVSANDFLSLFITLEFSTFGFYILVAYLRDDLRSNEAAIKFFILGALSAALIAYGVSLVYGETGTILFSEIAANRSGTSVGLMIGLLFIFIGISYKLGAVPFHAWVPDVYQGAPTTVTAYLSVVPKAATFGIFLRVVLGTFLDLKPDWQWMIVAIAVLSMTYGNITAIAQKNMKRLLAYSGIAQIGTVLIGLAAGTKMGSDAILFYLLTYLFANIGAFIVVIIFQNLTDKDDIEDLAGLNRRSPLMAFAMLVFLLSLAGVPPLAGFIGKVYVLVAAVNQGMIFLVSVALINMVISFYYYLIVLKKIYSVEPTETTPIDISVHLKIALYVSIAGVLFLGIWPKPFLNAAMAATNVFTDLVLK
jgi:NADH-quinone oxidoreductase subunit N